MTSDIDYYSQTDQNYGYTGTGYMDFPGNASSAWILSELNPPPTSVIDFGGARGHTAKHLSAIFSIPSMVMEKSPHCFHTRAVKEFTLHDMYDFPYPFSDKIFDIAYSNSMLEHCTYDQIDNVIREMARVSTRGYHVIGFRHKSGNINSPDIFFSDGTHIIYESIDWWKQKFETITPGYHIDIFNAYDAPETMKVPFLQNSLACLNLGCGMNVFGSGWVNIDVRDLSDVITKPYIFKCHDITTHLPYDNDSVDLLFIGNMLEVLPVEDGLSLMRECHRVLKPKGIIRIATIDSENLMRRYLNDDIDFLKHIFQGAEHAPCPIVKLAVALYNGNGTMYDRCLLRELVKRAGFLKMNETNAWNSTHEFMEKTTIVTYPTISMCLEVQK